jgi:hypothetical protein
MFEWLLSPRTESNRRPTDYKSVALPAELQRLLQITETLVIEPPDGIEPTTY